MRSQISALIVILLLACTGLQAGTREEMINDALSQINASLSKVPEGIQRVSVYAIEQDKDGNIDLTSLQDQISTVLLDSERFQVIDRKSLKTLLEEQQLSLTGMVDTTRMVQAGKLVGVQGFFFGSIESGKDSIILNLKLVDVQSSAIVYSKKFKGESSGFISIGAGFGYTPISIDWTGDDKSDLTRGGLGFILSYKQGFQGLKAGYAGVDLAMMYNFEESSNSVKRMDLKPKFIFSMKRLLKTEFDIITPYIGGALSMALLGDATKPTSIGFYPIAGMDINPTRFLSLFIEGMYITRTSLAKDSIKHTPAGLTWAAGIKAYLTF